MKRKHAKYKQMPYKIKRGDIVEVIRGKAQNKGQRGKVLKVLKNDARIVVERINYIYKHLRKSQEHPRGGRVEKEAPIAYSNVMLVCPHCNRRTRVNMVIEKVGDKDQKRRKCKKCGGVF